MGAQGIRATALLALVAAGCGGPIAVPVPETDGAVFFVSVSEASAPLRLEGPLILEGGTRRAGRAPAWVMEPEEARLFVIGVPVERVAEEVPGFDPEEAQALTLATVPPGEIGAERWWRPLPPAAKTWEVNLKTGAPSPAELPADLSLVLGVPRDPEHCRPGDWPPLEPYAQVLAPLDYPPVSVRNSAPAVHPLDHRRALLVWHHLALVEREGPFAPRTEGPHPNVFPAVRFADPGLLAPTFVAVALEKAPRDPHARRVWALIDGVRDDATEAWLHELRLEDGALIPVTSFALGGVVADDLDVDAEGKVLVVARGGPVLVLAAGATAVEALPPLPLSEVERFTSRARWTGLDHEPVLVTTASQLLLYSVATRRWLPTAVRVIGENVLFHSLAPSRDGELWAAGSRGTLYRKRGHEPWDLTSFDLPPRGAPCLLTDGTDQAPRLPSFTGLTHLGDHTFALPRECSALVAIRRSDLCTSMIEGAEGIEPLLRNHGMAHLSSLEDQLIAVSLRGEMYVSERR